MPVKTERKCFRCKQVQPVESFTKGMYECKHCNRERSRTWYAKNRSSFKSYARCNTGNSHKNYRERNRLFVYEYLFVHPCVDCGEDDIVVLEFDHINHNKQSDICRLMTRTYSLNMLKVEIQKCEVVCCNCHRKRTAKRGNWMKLSFLGENLEKKGGN